MSKADNKIARIHKLMVPCEYFYFNNFTSTKMQFTDIIILAYLVQQCSDDQDTIIISNNRLASEFNLSLKQVSDAIKRLNENCLISRTTKFAKVQSGRYGYKSRKITINFRLIQDYTDKIISLKTPESDQ